MKENVSPVEDTANGHMASRYRIYGHIRRTSSCRQLKNGGPTSWEMHTDLTVLTLKTLPPHEM